MMNSVIPRPLELFAVGFSGIKFILYQRTLVEKHIHTHTFSLKMKMSTCGQNITFLISVLISSALQKYPRCSLAQKKPSCLQRAQGSAWAAGAVSCLVPGVMCVQYICLAFVRDEVQVALKLFYKRLPT